MFGECENCGHKNYTGMRGCGCSWSERLEARQIMERERRKFLKKIGKPVLVDHLSETDCVKIY